MNRTIVGDVTLTGRLRQELGNRRDANGASGAARGRGRGLFLHDPLVRHLQQEGVGNYPINILEVTVGPGLDTPSIEHTEQRAGIRALGGVVYARPPRIRRQLVVLAADAPPSQR